MERYHYALLRQIDVHSSPWGGQSGAHNVGATEDELDGSLVHLHVREEERVCRCSGQRYVGEAATSSGEREGEVEEKGGRGGGGGGKSVLILKICYSRYKESINIQSGGVSLLNYT